MPVWGTLGGPLNLRPFKGSLSCRLGYRHTEKLDLGRVPGRLCQQLEIVECLFSHEKQYEGTQ